ncbi:hypothetical protein KXX64_001820, partial [Aspergillus fumigatus]
EENGSDIPSLPSLDVETAQPRFTTHSSLDPNRHVESAASACAKALKLPSSAVSLPIFAFADKRMGAESFSN